MPKRKFTIALFDENQDGEIIYYQWALPSGKRLDKIDCKMLSEQDLEIFPGAAEGAVNYVDNKTRFRESDDYCLCLVCGSRCDGIPA